MYVAGADAPLAAKTTGAPPTIAAIGPTAATTKNATPSTPRRLGLRPARASTGVAMAGVTSATAGDSVLSLIPSNYPGGQFLSNGYFYEPLADAGNLRDVRGVLGRVE